MSELLPQPEKRRRIPPRVREAVALICKGRARTITAAAKKVGLSREYLSRALGEPHIAEHLRQRAARAVAILSGHAAARITELINKSRSDHVAFEASKFSLGVAGIRPQPEAQLNVNIDIKAGFVIDLTEDRPMKLVAVGNAAVGGGEPAALPGAPATE